MPIALLDRTQQRPAIVDDATRREFLTGLTAAGLLAACGDDSTGDEAVDRDGYPRTVTDDAGVAIEIPSRPDRVVVTDNFMPLEAALALGVAPVQVGVNSFFDEFTGEELGLWAWQQDALADLGGDPERVDVDLGLNIEVVAQARPDLIVGRELVEKAGAPLRALAPTVQLPQDFRGAVTMLGEVFGLEDRAAEIVTEFEAALDEAVSGLVDGRPRIGVIFPFDDGTAELFADPRLEPYGIFLRAGFEPIEVIVSSAEPDALSVVISPEQLELLAEADVIVITAYLPEAADELEANPLFANLPAVQAGRVIRLEQGVVAQGFGIPSPLNLDVLVAFVEDVADLAP